jgi:hypothetical protein
MNEIWAIVSYFAARVVLREHHWRANQAAERPPQFRSKCPIREQLRGAMITPTLLEVSRQCQPFDTTQRHNFTN